MYYLMRACAKGSLRTITQHYDAALAQKLESVAHGGEKRNTVSKMGRIGWQNRVYTFKITNQNPKTSS